MFSTMTRARSGKIKESGAQALCDIRDENSGEFVENSRAYRHPAKYSARISCVELEAPRRSALSQKRRHLDLFH